MRTNFDLKHLLQPGVSCFLADQYPSSFFQLLFQAFKKQFSINFSPIQIYSSADWQAAKALLEMSFLGQQVYYYLGSLEVDLKVRREVYGYLANYQGPHAIVVCAKSADLPTDWQPPKLNLDQVGNSLNLLSKILPRVIVWRVGQFLQQAQVSLKAQFTLEQAASLVRYGELVKDFEEFDQAWLSKLVLTDHSLFELSKHFLFRDRLAFYKSWICVSEAYSEQFWVAFWSEQLFRAYWFVIYQKKGDFKLAKQVSFRLPFDFIKTGWRYIDPMILKESHDFLYQVDFQLKNGGSDLWLELFLNRFFAAKIR